MPPRATIRSRRRGGSGDFNGRWLFLRLLRRRRRGRRLWHRIAVGATGVALIEPYRSRVELVVLGAGLVAALEQRFRRHERVVALLGRRVAQELVEVPLCHLVAIELRAFARGIDLHLLDLAGVAN